MADLNSSLESSGLSAEETTTTTTTTTASTSTAVASSCEAMMWEGWSSHPSTSTGDEASISNIALLPELATTTSSPSRFHHQSDMLCNLPSSFHPLAPHPRTSDDNDGFLQQLDPTDTETTVSFGESSKSLTYVSGIPCPLPKREDHLSQWKASPWQQGPDSRWDASPWPGTTTVQLFHDEEESTRLRDIASYGQTSFGILADRHSEMNPVLVLNPHRNQNSSGSAMPPTAWIATSTPDSYAVSESPSTRSQQLLNFVRTAQDHQRFVMVEGAAQAANWETNRGANWNASRDTRVGEPRKQLRRNGEELSGSAPKRPHVHPLGDDPREAVVWRNRESGEDWGSVLQLRRMAEGSCKSAGLNSASAAGASSAVSQAMELFAIGPALNTNGKPRARRGSATDPQSVYARHRREKINERLKTLQQLVPNGAKVDIVTMLDEAVHYVQFLQLQVKLLKSDKYWIHATPNTYKGIDLTSQPT